MTAPILFGDAHHRISQEDGSYITLSSGATVNVPNSAGKGIALITDEAGAGSSDYGVLYIGSDGALIANSGDTGYVLRVTDKDTGRDMLKVGQANVETQIYGNAAVVDGALSIQNNNRVTMQYNSNEDCLDFIFS